MSDDEVLNRDFLVHLQTEYQRVRKHRVAVLLNVAGADGAPVEAETQRRYLHAALAFDPKPMAATLHDIMGRETSASADRITAAALYLHGGDKGWWEVPPAAAERAGKIIAPVKDQSMKPTKKRTAGSITAAADTDQGLYIAISQACIRMEAIVKDPATTDAGKLEAITRWMRIMGCIAPDQLDASLAKAWKTLNPQPMSI